MTNKVFLGDFMTNTLADKSVQLIIADPPYFEVKGSFDFIWSSFDAYLLDVEKWAKECKRLLADNGTLFWWGHAKKIAYAQIILDRYFNLENSLVWQKKQCQTMRGEPESMRTFAPVTERCLMYSNEILMTGLEVIKLDIENFQPLRQYSKMVLDFIGINLKQINIKLGHRKAEHFFYWNSTQWELATPETYAQLIEVFGIDKMPQFKEYESQFKEYESLRQEYEALCQEYEALRRPFTQTKLQTDVLLYSQEAHITKDYDHDTKKPETLTRQLILTCSRPNDLVFVPFAGSGTECAMAVKEGRQCIGYDIEQKYVDMSNKRIKIIISKPQLF